jgi:23S rRNA G2069 N7-methylase RlmK/C1962 C5-methylase RlmI
MNKILDPCCGSRMFWYQKNNSNVVFMDNRQLDTTLCDGRKLIISPDIIADFRNIPFEDNTFYLVVFDPPHLIKAGINSWLGLKYGILSDTWQKDIKKGFDECMRVLRPNGVLIFKWNEEQIKLKDILKVIDYQPLFGDKRSKTHWLTFMKDFEV